jgi:uncharacterized RDD family membrane protein YckC
MEYILDEQQFNQQQTRFADFGKRFAALILDSILLYFANWLLIDTLLGIHQPNRFVYGSQFDWAEYARVLSMYSIASYGIGWMYYALMESSAYQGTVGKVVLGIVVTDEQTGGRIGFGKATGRYFAKILSGIILGIGYLMMLWNKKEQTLHDKLAGTLVVQKP